MKPPLPFPASLALAIAVLSGTKEVVQQPVEHKKDSAETPPPADTIVPAEPTRQPDLARVKDLSTVIRTNFLKN